MRSSRVIAVALGGSLLFALAFTVPAEGATAAPCAAMTPPRRVTTAPVELPPSFTAARMGGIVVDEAVVGVDGKLSGLRLVRARFDILAPFGRKSVQQSRFEAASIEGNPVAARVRIETTLGIVSRARVEPEYDVVWAYVVPGQSREARWQLARSVGRLTVTAHLGTAMGEGGRIVAVAPDGKERLLVRIPPSAEPIDVDETVSTEKFFWAPGDYRLELRAGEKTVAWTTLTVADDYTRAIVNACRPI